MTDILPSAPDIQSSSARAAANSPASLCKIGCRTRGVRRCRLLPEGRRRMGTSFRVARVHIHIRKYKIVAGIFVAAPGAQRKTKPVRLRLCSGLVELGLCPSCFGHPTQAQTACSWRAVHCDASPGPLPPRRAPRHRWSGAVLHDVTCLCMHGWGGPPCDGSHACVWQRRARCADELIARASKDLRYQ